MVQTFQDYLGDFQKLRLREAQKAALDIGALSNKFIQDSAIWDKNIDKQVLGNKLNILVNVIRLIGLLLEPFVPTLSAKLYFILNIERKVEHETLIGTIAAHKHIQEAILEQIRGGHEIRLPIPLVTPGCLISR